MQGQRGRNERRAGVFLDVAHLSSSLRLVAGTRNVSAWGRFRWYSVQALGFLAC